MRTQLNIRLEFDPKYPCEIWIYDRIHGVELCKIINTDNMCGYLLDRISDAVRFNKLEAENA